MTMRYEIKDNSVLIYEGDSEIPFLVQPHWPDGSEWAVGEAEAWAEQAILAMTDPDADDAGDSPDQPTKPKFVLVEPEPEALPE